MKLCGKSVLPDRALTLISAAPPRWKRGRSIARYSNTVRRQQWEVRTNGMACLDNDIYASSWPSGIAPGYTICVCVCFNSCESFGRANGGKTRGYAIHAKHYFLDKALRFCSRTSSSPVRPNENTYLSPLSGIRDYRRPQSEICPGRDQTCGSILDSIMEGK